MIFNHHKRILSLTAAVLCYQQGLLPPSGKAQFQGSPGEHLGSLILILKLCLVKEQLKDCSLPLCFKKKVLLEFLLWRSGLTTQLVFVEGLGDARGLGSCVAAAKA